MTDTTQTQATGPVDDAIDAIGDTDMVDVGLDYPSAITIQRILESKDVDAMDIAAERMANAIAARLAPRAPMPNVVTMRERAAKWIAIQDGIRWDYLTDDMKADWFPLADELIATLFDAEVGS